MPKSNNKVKFLIPKSEKALKREQLEQRIKQRKDKQNKSIDDVFDYLDDINEKLDVLMKRH